jgi:hypothetical protein
VADAAAGITMNTDFYKEKISMVIQPLVTCAVRFLPTSNAKIEELLWYAAGVDACY